MDKKRAIEIALLYIPTMLGDEADLGITYKDLEEVPNVLKAMLNDYEQGRADAIEEYKGKMLSRLIPHLNDLECAKDSETYLAITEIAEQLKENKND